MQNETSEKLFAPKYYKNFNCLAGSCPDSCCRSGWEIPLDSDTLRFYRAFGIKDIDENICPGTDGDIIFKLNGNGDCLYLESDGLCRLYKLTDGRLGDVCAKYPRYFEEYDGFTETGISVSCPEAARIVLSAVRDDYNVGAEESDDELLDYLVKARNYALDIAFSQDESDISALRLIDFGAWLQENIDFGELDDINYYESPENIGVKPSDGEKLLKTAEFILNNAEILCPEWEALLENIIKGERRKEEVPENKKRALLGYLIYRFFLKAINTEDILSVCMLISSSYFICVGANCDFIEAVRLFSKEIEHDDCNVDALIERFAGDGANSVI